MQYALTADNTTPPPHTQAHTDPHTHTTQRCDAYDAHSDLSGNRFTGQLPREVLLTPLNVVSGTLYLRNLTVRRISDRVSHIRLRVSATVLIPGPVIGCVPPRTASQVLACRTCASLYLIVMASMCTG